MARLPFFSPDPCVAVLHAPAIEMWGSEAKLCSANPLLSRYGHSWPYVMPASTVTVRAPAVQRHHLVHRLQRKQIVAAVRDGVETVPRAEHLHFFLGPQIERICSTEAPPAGGPCCTMRLPAQLVSFCFLSMPKGRCGLAIGGREQFARRFVCSRLRDDIRVGRRIVAYTTRKDSSLPGCGDCQSKAQLSSSCESQSSPTFTGIERRLKRC